MSILESERKKIIYIANARIPTEKAHGLQIMKTCEAFADHGVEVELIMPRRINNFTIDPFQYYGVRQNFIITKMPCFDLIFLDQYLGNWALWIQSFSFLIAVKIYLLFKVPGYIYTREQFVGFIFNKINLEMHAFPEKIKFWQKLIFKKCNKIFVLTSFIKQALIERGIDHDKIIISPDAVDLAQFDIAKTKIEARKFLGLPLDKKIILYCGSFFVLGWKGLDIVLEASKLFDDEYLFVLVGGLAKEVEFINSNYDVKNIRLFGHRPPTEIPVFLKTADVLVLPNKKGDVISEKHTSPMKLFEYMASKRPIVASDLPSIREILNEDLAVLVEPNNPEKLAAGIKQIIVDEKLADKLSINSFSEVEKKYTWEQRTKNIINYISDK